MRGARRVGDGTVRFVLAPSPDDDRIEPVHEAIAFWNERLELGVETRLAGPRVVVASSVDQLQVSRSDAGLQRSASPGLRSAPIQIQT